jgi:hypothetical protein
MGMVAAFAAKKYIEIFKIIIEHKTSKKKRG